MSRHYPMTLTLLEGYGGLGAVSTLMAAAPKLDDANAGTALDALVGGTITVELADPDGDEVEDVVEVPALALVLRHEEARPQQVNPTPTAALLQPLHLALEGGHAAAVNAVHG